MNDNKDIDLSQIDNIEFDGIDHDDAPRFCDAFIVTCDYMGRDITEEEMELLESMIWYDTNGAGCWFAEKLHNHIY